MNNHILRYFVVVFAVGLMAGCATKSGQSAAPNGKPSAVGNKLSLEQQIGDELNENDRLRFDYFYLEAVCQQQKGNYAAAFDLFRRCKEINPNAAEVYFSLSSYYAELGQDSMTMACMEKAAQLSPNNNYYLERLGQSLLNMRRFDRATAIYEQLSEVDKTRTDVLSILLQLYQREKNYNKMIDVLNRIELVDGTSDEIVLSKMHVYSQQGKKKEEYRELKNLSDKHPYDMNYRVMMGNWLLQNDRKDDALRQYMDVLKKEPDNMMAQMSMLDYYKAQGQDSLAKSMTEQLLLSSKTDTESRIALLRQVIQDDFEQGGDSTEVLRLFDRMLSQPQQSSDVAEMKLAYMMLRGLPQDSINVALNQILAISPDNSAARIQLIQSIWREENYDEVIRQSRAAIEYIPDEMAFYYFLGFAYFQKDESDEALDAFRRGVSQINAQSNKEFVSDFYAIMGEILYQKGLEDEAFAAYDSCLQWKADNYGCLNNYAYFLSLKGKDLKRAEQMSYRTVNAEPDNATFLDTYAWILFLQERYDEAKVYMDRTLENDSVPGAVVLEHAGDIYAKNGDMDKAVGFWQQALEKDTGNALLQRKVRQRKYIKE